MTIDDTILFCYTSKPLKPLLDKNHVIKKL